MEQWKLWINNLKIYTVRFDCMLSWGLSNYIETKLQTTCFYLVKKLFFKKKNKTKRVWNSSLPNSLFSVWSLKNNISLVVFFAWPNFIAWFTFPAWDNWQWAMCLLIRLRFEKLSFSSNCFFTWPKSQERKELLTFNVPIPDEVKKIKLNFYFHTSLRCLKRFYEGP